jgi:hypothetical protein
MVRKISFLILSVAILVSGVIAAGKLGYWDRSVRIFSLSSSTPFEGGKGGRQLERGEFGDRGNFDRQRTAGEGPDRRETHELPDSIRQKFQPPDRGRFEAGSFNGGTRNGGGGEGGEFHGGKKLSLINVLWFLAVFASFTVIAIYADKGLGLLRRRKANRQRIAEIEL